MNATITINGTAFTAVASGATGNQFNIGANLAATLTNIVTVLSASVVPAVQQATYTQTGGNTLVILSVIDNLVKGAAGQAVQNMNLMFGLDECSGLLQVPVLP